MQEKNIELLDFLILGEEPNRIMQELTLSNYMVILREDLNRYLEINSLSPEAFGQEIDISGRAIRNILDGITQSVDVSTWLRIRTRIHLKTYTSRPGGK